MNDRASPESPRRLSLLQEIRIAAPCDASWEEMAGDERVRFCGDCQKNVYNLSSMARDEAERLLREREASICVRFYQRADGTVLTADCPVGVRRRLMRRTALAIAGAGLMATGAALAALVPGRPGPVTMMGAAPAQTAVEVAPTATQACPLPPEPVQTVTGGVAEPPPRIIVGARAPMGKPSLPPRKAGPKGQEQHKLGKIDIID